MIRDKNVLAAIIKREAKKLTEIVKEPNEEIDILEWAKQFYVIEKLPFTLKDREYLREIFEVFKDHPKIVVRKSAQCGVSELAILISFYFVKFYRENVFYAFPAEAQLGDFVRGRVNPRVTDSDYFFNNSKITNNVGIKRFFDNFIYYRGSTNRRQIISVDAGLLILDEYDLMIQNHIPVMRRRLGASKFAKEIDLSTPMYELLGIDAEFLKTDQREWHIKCDECQEEQVLDFFKNIYPAPPDDPYEKPIKEPKYICQFCGTDIDNTKSGRWIPKYPERKVPGFHISKMFIKPAAELWENYRDALQRGAIAIREFYNSDLGLAHSPEGGKITDNELDACRANIPKEITKLNCYMGVDVGRVLNVVISKSYRGVNYRLFIGLAKDFEELAVLMKQYDVASCIVDAMPETREALRFSKKFRGRVWLAFYNLREDSQRALFDDKKRVVRIHRTNSMDYAANQVKIRKTRFAYTSKEIPGFYNQMKAPQRVEEINEKTGNIEYKYLEGTSEDHYFHANNYCETAMMKDRPVSIDVEDIQHTNDEQDIDVDYEDQEDYDLGFESDF